MNKRRREIADTPYIYTVSDGYDILYHLKLPHGCRTSIFTVHHLCRIYIDIRALVI